MSTLIDNVIDSIVSPQTTGQPIQAEVRDAAVLLGYSGGNSWPTFRPYEEARPDLDRGNRVIPVTLSCVEFGHMYDIEAHGGKNENIGVFMHNAKFVWKTQLRWGLQWLYTFASNVEAMIEAARSFGYEHGRDYYILAAHPNSRFGRHVCSPGVCGYPAVDGTQYLFTGGWDRSVINAYMLQGFPVPPPSPPPMQEEDSLVTTEVSHDGTLHVFELQNDWIWYTFQKPHETGWNGGKQGQSIAGMVPFAPAQDVVSIGARTSVDGALHVFGRKKDGSLVYTYQLAGQTGWQGGTPGKSIAGLLNFAPAPGH